MIVILDTAKGQAFNFKTRKDAGEFIGVSLPTLRLWLLEPFFLYKTLIITLVHHEKVLYSNRELVKRQMENFVKNEKSNNEPVDLPGCGHKLGNIENCYT